MREEIFKKYLETKGQRFTKERDAILQEAFSCEGHFDPETLYMDMRKRGMKASRASVYRTLNLLYECGLVEKVSKSEHGTIYEQALGRQHHDHMVCLNCGKVIEFYSESLEKLQDEICCERDFTGKSHTLEIRGYCGHCEKEKNDREGENLDD
jgi:Fur family transcriptional regulator, ferric uptake regulator